MKLKKIQKHEENQSYGLSKCCNTCWYFDRKTKRCLNRDIVNSDVIEETIVHDVVESGRLSLTIEESFESDFSTSMLESYLSSYKVSKKNQREIINTVLKLLEEANNKCQERLNSNIEHMLFNIRPDMSISVHDPYSFYCSEYR